MRSLKRFTLVIFLFALASNALGSYFNEEITAPLLENLKSNPNQVLKTINKYKKDSIAFNDKRLNIQLLRIESNAYKLKEDYKNAYYSSKEAVRIVESIPDTLLKTELYFSHGNISYIVFQEEESKEYQQKALNLTKELYQKGQVTAFKLYQAHVYEIRRCIRFQKFYEASLYLEKCFELHKEHNFGELSKAYLNSKKSFLLLKMNEVDLSLSLTEENKNYFENFDNTDRPIDHKAILPTIYSQLGELYRLKGDFIASKKYLDKALLWMEKYPSNKSHRPVILESYAWLLYQTGDYKKATAYLNESKKLSEAFFFSKSLNEEEYKIVQVRYQGELNQRMQELISKSLEISEKDQVLWRYRILATALCLILVIGGLIFKIKKVRDKHKKEKKVIKEKAKKSREMLKLKNKELTESTLKQIEKDKIINQLKEELTQNPTNNTSKLLKTIDLNSKMMWEDFNNRFMAVNQDFYKNLNIKFPDLTANDQKLCALIKLNFSTKEMARLLGVSTEAVQKGRYRLRKKLGLETGVNLSNYIASL